MNTKGLDQRLSIFYGPGLDTGQVLQTRAARNAFSVIEPSEKATFHDEMKDRYF